MDDSTYGPTFIVGAPRSGTTLVASMIAAHPNIYCGPETHFFNKLDTKRLETACQIDWPRAGVKALKSLKLADQRVLDLYGLSLADLYSALESREPSTESLLSAMIEPRMRSLGKSLWAEKTPNHLYCIDRIRQSIPSARFIMVVRDPRDVARSMMRLPWASQSRLANALLWKAWYHIGIPQAEGAQHLRVRFEDLIASPEVLARQIADFVGQPYDRAMLNMNLGAADVSTRNETWKASNFHQIDPKRSGAWKGRADEIDRLVADLCYEEAALLGYDVARCTTTDRIFRWEGLRKCPTDRQIQVAAESGVRTVPVLPTNTSLNTASDSASPVRTVLARLAKRVRRV